MFYAYEQALKTHLADVLPGAPIYGTFDEPDLEHAPMYVQIVWLGYQIDSQSAARTEASLQQRFAVRIGFGVARVDAAQVAVAANALAAVLRKVLAFAFGDRPGRIRPVLTPPPPPAYAGAAAEFAVYFTLQGVATAQAA